MVRKSGKIAKDESEDEDKKEEEDDYNDDHDDNNWDGSWNEKESNMIVTVITVFNISSRKSVGCPIDYNYPPQQQPPRPQVLLLFFLQSKSKES